MDGWSTEIESGMHEVAVPGRLHRDASGLDVAKGVRVVPDLPAPLTALDRAER